MPLLLELIDIIIDKLHNDKHTLSACCLTSKQWVPSCQFHLFSKITVTPHRISSVLHFLESHSPSIALLVRNLVVDDFSEWGLDEDPEEGTKALLSGRQAEAHFVASSFHGALAHPQLLPHHQF